MPRTDNKGLAHIRILAAEQCLLVEFTDRSGNIDDLAEPLVGLQIYTPFMLVGAAIVVRGQVWAKTRDCAQQEDHVKVKVLKAFWIGCDAIDEALEIWTLD